MHSSNIFFSFFTEPGAALNIKKSVNLIYLCLERERDREREREREREIKREKEKDREIQRES